MAKKLKVLQVGNYDWQIDNEISDKMIWTFVSSEELVLWHSLREKKDSKFDVLIIDNIEQLTSVMLLDDVVDPYRVFYCSNSNQLSEECNYFLSKKIAKKTSRQEMKEYLGILPKLYFPGQAYGQKMSMKNIMIHPLFSSKVNYAGNYYTEINFENQKDFQQLAYWCYPIAAEKNQPVELWLEYQKQGECEIKIKITSLLNGYIDHIMETFEFSQEQMQDSIIVETDYATRLFVSVEVKGSGSVQIGALHFRYSRRDVGIFLPGGKRMIDKNREEIFYYYHPGDMKPPLNVYFSGYRTLEGFEGYFIMNQMGSPFLLIADPRLEGGSFYMGSDEYEKNICQIIESTLEKLGFTNQELVLSGLSMGTYGALYYASHLEPKAVIVGKPLVNAGDIALNGVLKRPNEFQTSFDLLYSLEKENTKQAAFQLNRRFWNQFNQADFSKTLFAFSYMLQDDYDKTAYSDMLKNLEHKRARVIGRGFIGRHNDNSFSILEWFLTQYRQILKENFDRE